MGENYVVKGAKLSCQYGMTSCDLMVPQHRHIFLKDKEIANQTDITEECISGFGGCTSPYKMPAKEVKELPIDNRQQFVLCGIGGECMPFIRIPWQDTQKDVKLAYYEALKEKGWTICENGFGIISLIDCGQEEENKMEQLMERLQELEAEVEAYMEKEGIKGKEKEKLLSSVLLWNGYMPTATTWEEKSDQQTRAFCQELSQKNPSLFNYFERKIKVKDKQGEEVDFTYMAGVYQGLKGKKDEWEGVSEEMINDRSMYNAYLDACNQYASDPKKSLAEMCKGYSSYEGTKKRYSTYANMPDEAAREWYHPSSEEWIVYEEAEESEKNLMLQRDAIAGRIRLSLGEEEEAQRIARAFIGKLREDMWRE